MSRDFQAGDHIHPLAFENHTPTPVAGFDYDEIDRRLGCVAEPEKPVEFSDMAAAFSLVLEWVCRGSGVSRVASRAYALEYFLSPTTSKFGSLDEIATACNTTRQSCSKALMELRDNCGLALPFGKISGSRSTYSRAQKASYEIGEHSAFKRRDRKTAQGAAE